jgi:hypothetical protein
VVARALRGFPSCRGALLSGKSGCDSDALLTVRLQFSEYNEHHLTMLGQFRELQERGRPDPRLPRERLFRAVARSKATMEMLPLLFLPTHSWFSVTATAVKPDDMRCKKQVRAGPGMLSVIWTSLLAAPPDMPQSGLRAATRRPPSARQRPTHSLS